MAYRCVQILKPKQSVPLPIRSVHIKPSPNETNKTEVPNSISRPKPKNPTSNGSHTRPHALTTAPRTLTHATSDSWLPDHVIGTHAAMTASSSIDLQKLRFRPSSKLTRTLTRYRISGFSSTRWWNSHAPKNFANVIWCHRIMSSLHVSNHVSTSTSALIHVI